MLLCVVFVATVRKNIYNKQNKKNIVINIMDINGCLFNKVNCVEEI